MSSGVVATYGGERDVEYVVHVTLGAGENNEVAVVPVKIGLSLYVGYPPPRRPRGRLWGVGGLFHSDTVY